MKKVVIAGGGFAGLETALRLRNQNKDVEIILINGDDCFAFVPSLYETAAGELSDGDICILISALVNPLNIIYYHDCVERINLREKFVLTKNKMKIVYDFLVIAVGSETNYYDIHGVKEFAHNLKSKDDAQKIYEYVNNALESKNEHDFVVIGGGLTGVEFAGTLKDHIVESCKKFRCSPDQFSVTIVHGAETILHGIPAEAVKFATDYLENNGVKILVNSPVVRLSKNVIYTADKKKIPYDFAVWAGGLKTHMLITKNKLKFSDAYSERAKAGGGMLVNDFLQYIDDESVFGAGDCICPKNQKLPVIKTAQNAVDQSRIVAYNINAKLRRKKMMKYSPINNMFYAALGKRMGVYMFGKKILTGENIKRRKDLLEQSYVANLRKGKISQRNIYDV